MTRAEVLPSYYEDSLICSGRSAGSLATVLIQVPRVHLPSDRADRSRRIALDLPPGRPRASRRGRRRLKREVRLALRILVGLFVLAMACSPYGFGHHGAHAGLRTLAMQVQPSGALESEAIGRGSAGMGGNRPSVVLSVEPSAAASERECDAPVVLPGYLLPDDGHEESSHEGS